MESQHLEMVNQCPAVSAGEIYQYDGFPGTITKTIYVVLEQDVPQSYSPIEFEVSPII